MAKRQPYSFSDKTVLLTGATGGLGSVMARRLSEEGARLVLSSRSLIALNELIATLADPDNARAVTADLMQPGEASRLAVEALSVWGDVDVLFNNAGIGYFAMMEEVDEERMRWIFEVNTFSPLMLIKGLLPGMKRRGGGRIINLVSCAGRIPIPTNAVYGGSKSALAVMTNTMRLECDEYGIDIVNIYPGTVDTSFEENAFKEKGRDRLCPRDHCGKPREEMAMRILEASRGGGGDIFLDRRALRMAVRALARPDKVDKEMIPLKNRLRDYNLQDRPPDRRRWRLWQVESSIACNLRCVMCPWEHYRNEAAGGGIMNREVWDALKPYLPEVASIDFSGGGEPMLNSNLLQWIEDAVAAGCRTGFLTNGMLLDPNISQHLIETGLDWIAFSIDGATADVFEKIRHGASFDRLVGNIKTLREARHGKKPEIYVNFVMMPMNIHQLNNLVVLSAGLGVDRVTFKQCDVVRGDSGKGFGLFEKSVSRDIRKYERLVKRARHTAKRLGVAVETFSFIPEEQPVCGQDPRDSLFIRFDGKVAPCVSLAYGGPTEWLGRQEQMPSVHYGQLPDDNLAGLWETVTCRHYRTHFEERERAYSQKLAEFDHEPSLERLKATLEEARKAMPDALEGCRICHYLYGI